MKKALFLVAAICSAIAFPCPMAAAETVSLTLADSIDMALFTDESIEGAEAGREAALHAWKAARRSKGPAVSWESQAVRIGGRDYESAKRAHALYGDPHQEEVTVGSVLGVLPVYSTQTVGSYAYNNSFSNSLSLSVPLYTGGRLENRIKEGRYQLNKADLTVENTRQTVRYQVAEAYANLLHYENLAKVAKDAVDMGLTQLDLIRAQFEEGAVAEADMLTMSVSIANYKQNLVNAEKSVDVAKSTLASMVGLPQDTDVKPLDYFSYEPYDKELPECEEYALAHRPDGLAADYDIMAAKAQKEAAKSGWRPRVTGVGTRSIAGNAPFGSERNSNWQAGVSVSWNIFDSGVTSENVRQADAMVNQYEALARKSRKKIRLETRTAWLSMKAAEQNIKETALAVEQAEDSYKISQVRYEEGVDIIISVTNAQEKLTQARSNYMTALYQYNLSRANLEKAMGVPVGFDALAYVEAAGQGASADEALTSSLLPEQSQ